MGISHCLLFCFLYLFMKPPATVNRCTYRELKIDWNNICTYRIRYLITNNINDHISTKYIGDHCRRRETITRLESTIYFKNRPVSGTWVRHEVTICSKCSTEVNKSEVDNMKLTRNDRLNKWLTLINSAPFLYNLYSMITPLGVSGGSHSSVTEWVLIL